MRCIKIVGWITVTLTAVIGLSSCTTSHVGYGNREYIRHAQTVSPIKVPPNASAPKQQPFYPLPKLADIKEAEPVSLVPPGSKVNQYRLAKRAAKNKNGNDIAVAQNKSALQSLLLKTKDSQRAWASVGRALRKTPYQILDADSGLKSYYVLDTKSTNNRITDKTPIFRVQIQAAGKNNQVSIYNQANKPANPQVASRILMAVKSQLS